MSRFVGSHVTLDGVTWEVIRYITGRGQYEASNGKERRRFTLNELRQASGEEPIHATESQLTLFSKGQQQ